MEVLKVGTWHAQAAAGHAVHVRRLLHLPYCSSCSQGAGKVVEGLSNMAGGTAQASCWAPVELHGVSAASGYAVRALLLCESLPLLLPFLQATVGVKDATVDAVGGAAAKAGATGKQVRQLRPGTVTCRPAALHQPAG